MASAVKADMKAPVILVRGNDPTLVNQAVHHVVDQLVGMDERALVLEEFDAPRYDDDRGERGLGAVIDSAQTSPFLTDFRVVVARHLGCFTTQESVAALTTYLADPLPSTRLVLVWEPHPTPQVRSGSTPKKLLERVKAIGQIIETDAGKGKDRIVWVKGQLDGSSLKFARPVAAHLAEWAGEDPGRIASLLITLEGAFAPNTALDVDDIGVYLGEAGDMAPWDLTDAIDGGDIAGSLEVLQRMMHAGRHPLQLLATLHNHVGKMLALDGSGANDNNAAALVVGGAPFTAGKAMKQGRKLGSERIADMVGLLARADLDLKGARQYPGDVRDAMVMEMLVARLASRSRR